MFDDGSQRRFKRESLPKPSFLGRFDAWPRRDVVVLSVLLSTCTCRVIDDACRLLLVLLLLVLLPFANACVFGIDVVVADAAASMLLPPASTLSFCLLWSNKLTLFPLYPLAREVKACLAQQKRVVGKANEYRLFAHGVVCYFDRRLSDMPALEVGGAFCLHILHRKHFLPCWCKAL